MSDIISTDPDFKAREELIHRVVGAQGFMKLVGGAIDHVSPGQCHMSLQKRPELLQQFGMFHGGVTAFLIDNATTTAAATVMPAGKTCLTAEYKLNFLSPAVGDKLLCRAKVVKAGRSLSIVAADVFCITNGTEKHTATALATISIIEGATPEPAK